MKEKPKRVVCINSETCVITEAVVTDLPEMQKLVGGYIERAMILQNGDELYVNEEGLLQDENTFFRIVSGHQPFAGNAYVIGSVDSEGYNHSAKSTVEEIKNQVRFLGKGRHL